jgi:hypothetical protein
VEGLEAYIHKKASIALQRVYVMGIRWSEDFWVTLERVPMAGSCKPEQKPCEEEVTAVCQEALSITDMAKKL